MKKFSVNISFMALFAALIAGGAWLSIPIPPVPVVLANLVAALSGIILGPLWGLLSVLLYLGLGALGLPVFAGGSGGLGVFYGPSGGFLAGYALSAFVAGLLADRKEWNPLRNVLALIAGFIALYALGLPWLDYKVYPIQGLIPAAAAMLPYMAGDVVKAFFGAYLVVLLKPYLKRQFPVQQERNKD